jgi:hypothetical protein
MTDSVRRGEPVRSMGSKAAFVVIAAVVWALVIMIDDLIQSHETPALSMYMWQPGSLFRSNPVLETVRNLTTYGFILGAPIYYRNSYTRTRWARDTFVAMLAVYTIGFCILALIYHAIRHSVWTISLIGAGVVACVLCTAFSVFWAWVFTARIVRMLPKRPYGTIIPPND